LDEGVDGSADEAAKCRRPKPSHIHSCLPLPKLIVALHLLWPFTRNDIEKAPSQKLAFNALPITVLGKCHIQRIKHCAYLVRVLIKWGRNGVVFSFASYCTNVTTCGSRERTIRRRWLHGLTMHTLSSVTVSNMNAIFATNASLDSLSISTTSSSAPTVSIALNSNCMSETLANSSSLLLISFKAPLFT